MKKIKVVVKKPFETAKVVEVEAKLETFQELVGGYIDAVCPDEQMDRRGIAVYLNDDGKLEGLVPNLRIFDGLDFIVGTCVFVKADEEGADISLEPEDIAYVMQYCRKNAIHLGELISF